IYHNNTWGTVCDDNWDFNDAKVVCRELGCGVALSAPQSAFFGPGTGQIWLDNVNCSGSETSLSECQHGGFGTHNCQHNEDAGVVCSGVRLVGSTRCSGRVEIYHNKTWGTVCDDNWDFSDAEVVCRELGCGVALSAPQSAHFGEGTGQIWLDEVDCSGSETSLSECQHGGFGIQDCQHAEDAGVVCSGVRLVGPGSDQCSGRVEIYHSNTWGTVCDDDWDFNDAKVVCRELGCGVALSAPQSAFFGPGTGQIWLRNVNCSGSETSLNECQHGGFGTHDCGHGEDAGVVCSGEDFFSFIKCSISYKCVRLVGSTRCSGRVEFYHNNTWGTVCDDDWDFNDAKVVCRELGCGTALSAPESAHFGEGTEHIWLDEVDCSGSERSLSECQHGGFGIHDCQHGEDAGVVCSGEKSFESLTVSDICCNVMLVEIYHNNTWGTVCDDSWDFNDAKVVCRELDCGTALNATQSAHFGPGTGQIWLDNVNCSGSEGSLNECQHGGFGTHNCQHNEDAGVVCSGVRLVGSTRCSGRVEIYHSNTWGTVCDDNWDFSDAEVVCRELGCGVALNATQSAFFGQGTGQIWLDEVKCSGSEMSLTECQHGGFGKHNCQHNEDAGVVCSGVRLVGSTRCSGRVEIYHSNTWGTVCDDNWDFSDAEVVCRELGCGVALNATQSAFFGPGTGQIWLDEVKCSGSEMSLTECQHGGFGKHNCGHGEDAGVVCSGVRLVGPGSDWCSGRVEIYHSNTWGTVCDDSWDFNDAKVVCRELGCGVALNATQSAHFGPGTGQIWLDNVDCSGTETSLSECQHRGFGTHNCQHNEDAGVVCSGSCCHELLTNHFHNVLCLGVRLVGSTRCSGRVEIYHNKTWGTVCDDSWDFSDAEVVCRELGCGTALSAPHSAHFGEGTGQIWLDEVKCSGTETSLTECQHGGFGTHNCQHNEDAGVVCSGEKCFGLNAVFKKLLLVGPGSDQCSGRVEIYHNNTWGTVCDDDWDFNDAKVVCRELGCGVALSAPQSAFFGPGIGQIWLRNVNCSGSETSLNECQHGGFGTHDCGHGEDAGVVCSGVRLVGSTRCSGRVEIYHDYTWGTVCDNGWDLNDAKVVCRELDCGVALSAPHSAHFGEGTGHIWLNEVDCSGSERSLSECQHRGFGTHNCGHGEDAGVVCSGEKNFGSDVLLCCNHSNRQTDGLSGTMLTLVY
uniref:Soluble scavenger receptor cysteine-rich domain-containing protein SSC5D n=1 Tax=Lates calcarifer TaxID=8187 RepID=A0A4W6BNI6_LATCA